MLKNFVGSNTEVTGKISVSSQKDKAEKSHRLGKKRLNCVGNDKDQKLLLLRSQPVLLIFVPCVGECGFILHCLLLVERVVGDAVPGHCPLSCQALYFGIRIAFKIITVVGLHHPLISTCCRRQSQRKGRSALQMKMTVELRCITVRRKRMIRRKRQLKRNLR